MDTKKKRLSTAGRKPLFTSAPIIKAIKIEQRQEHAWDAPLIRLLLDLVNDLGYKRVKELLQSDKK